MPISKFYGIKLGECFFIKKVLCRKTSAITYVVTGADEFLGEFGYDPIIDKDLETVAEASAEAPVAAPAPKKKAAKKKAKKKKR